MELTVITEHLFKQLDNDSDLVYNSVIAADVVQNIIYNLTKATINILNIIDLTSLYNYPDKSKIEVKDHINKTGNNPLIGQQQTLGIDFIDITSIYTFNKNAIVTTCCGDVLNKNEKHPSHYLCHISIIAKALNIKTINAYLYNIHNIKYNDY